jgi:glycosyltransferase involved in cell wall biosynthesis
VRIAITGSAGIPSTGGRMETVAERLAQRFVDRRHEVTVYCRPGAVPAGIRAFKGARLIHLPLSNGRPGLPGAAAAWHATHVLRPDVVLALVDAAAPVWPTAQRRDVGLVVHVVGAPDPDAAPERRSLTRAERRMARNADAITTDSHSLAAALSERYGRDVAVVRHGVEDPGIVGRQTLNRLRLASRRYLLALSLPDDPRADRALVDAFRAAVESAGDAEPVRLVLAGADPVEDQLVADLVRDAPPWVVVPGRVSEPARWQLMHHAAVVAVPPGVEGAHPLVLDALAAGACLLASPSEATAQTADGAVAWRAADGDELAQQLASLLADSERQAEHRDHARAHARRYDWDAVAAEFERALQASQRARRPGALPPELRDGPSAPPPAPGVAAPADRGEPALTRR